MTALSEAPAPPEEWEVPAEPEAKASFRILNDRMAAWGMRRLRAKTLRRRQIVADADAEIERWKRWKLQETSRVDADIAYFEGVLTRYLLEVRADREDGRKTVTTPYGDITSRKTQPSWSITDMDAAVAWAKAHRPKLVRTVESFALSDAKAELGAEFRVPGVEVTPGGVSASFAVDLKAGGS